MFQLVKQSLVVQGVSTNPAEPAEPTFPNTAPGTAKKGAASPLRAGGWLTAQGGRGGAVTPLRTSLIPGWLP